MTTPRSKINYGALPAIPTGLDPAMRRFFEGVAESMEVMKGQRGDKLDRAIRLRDIQPGSPIGASLINALINRVKGDLEPSGDPLNPPTSFQAIAAFDSVMLVWDYNRSPNYDRTEIFRASVQLDAQGNLTAPIPQFSDQYLIGAISGDRFNDKIVEGYRYYYWARHVTSTNVPGAFAGPVNCVAAPLPSAILDRIQTEINDDAFIQKLSDAIALGEVQPVIDQLNAQLTSDIAAAENRLKAADTTLTGQIANANTALSTVEARLGVFDSAAGKYSFIKTLELADASNATRIGSLESDNGTSKSRILSLETTSASEASKVSALQTDNGSNKSRLSSLETTTGSHATRLTSIETTNTSQGSSISSLQSTTDSLAVSITRLGAYDAVAGKYSFIKTLEQADTSQASRIGDLETDNGTSKSRLTSLETTTGTQASRLTTLETDNGTNKSNITSLQNTKADSASVTTLISTAKGEAIASAISSARTYTDQVSGELKSEYVLKVGVDGKVAGFGLLAGGISGTQMAFSADKFTFVNPDGTDKDLGLGLLIKQGSLYFNKAVAREIIVEDITFKRGIGLDLSVLENLQLPIGRITEANIAPAFLNRIVLRDPNAVVTGGNQSIVRSLNFVDKTGQTGSFITAPIVGGNGLTRVTINVSLEDRTTILQSTRPPVPTAPAIHFRIMRGTTEVLIPTDVMNAVNANSYGYTLVRDTGKYVLTGASFVEAGGYTTGGARFWEVGVHLAAQFAFDGGYYSGSSGFILNIIQLDGNIGVATMGMNVFEASSSSDGLIVKTEWSNIQSKPTTIAGFGISDGVSSNGGNLFSGGGSFRAFSIRNTDSASWSWFAMGGTSDAGGGVWHIATNGTATDIGLGGALHIRGANGANSSMVINQDHSVRFRHLDIYAGATNSGNGWRLWHDGNAPVYAIRWPTLAEIGAMGSGGGSFNGVVTFNSEVHTNNMMTFSSPMLPNYDHVGSPISIRERGRVGSTYSDAKYAPNLNFHWAGRISNSLWMDAAGTLSWGAYGSDGTPNGNGSFNTSWISASTLSTVGKGGMIAYNGTAGMVLRTQDAGGGFARGIITENAAGTRLAGAGFLGDSNGVYSFAISLKETWWAAPQFEVVSNSVNINSTYLTLTSGWDISWGGRWWSGFPTITGLAASGGADAALSLYPNGNTGGRYYLTTSKLMFPTPFDTYMAPQGSGFFGLLSEVGNAKPLAIGGLLVSSAYNEVSSVPANGMIVRGSAVIGSNIDPNAQEYYPSRSQLQIYSLNGSEARLAFHRGGYTATTLVHDGDGLYLTNGTLRATGFKMKGRATTITTGAGNQDAISIQSPYGYIDIGSLNPTYAHITTDRPYFYMDKELSIQNGVDIYGTQWYFGRNSKAKIGSFQARHIDGLSPDGTLYDSLYLNYINNNDVVVGEGGGARLIAKSLINQVMARWTSSEDARSVGLRPPTSYQNVATFEFLWGSTLGIGLEEYVGSLVFRPYGTGSDFSGGPVHKLHFASGGRLFHQMGEGAGWASHLEIPQYDTNGYLYARSWINLPSGTGIFFSDGVTHLRHLGNGQMALQGSAGTTFLRIDAAGSAQGFLYGEVGGNIGLLDNTGSWVLQCVAGSKMVYVKDFTVTSDSRLKDNQQLIKNALHKVRRMLNGKTYIRNDSGRLSAGLIAQDVLQALPEAVTIEEKTGFYTVNYNGVIGLLVEAIKELADIVDGRGTTWQQ